jgi:hypothetical protein
MNVYSAVHAARLSNAAIRLGLSGALMMIPVHAQAQIFECIDAGGKIEFAQKCSPGTVKQREVSTAGESNPVGGKTPPPPSYKDEEFAFRQRQLEREAQEAKAKAAATTAAKNCQSARSRLASIESARRVRGGTDPKTGEVRYLDDNEREAATQKERDAVAKYCK